MLLSNESLCLKIFGDPARSVEPSLSIVPKPERKILALAGGASIDLRLGRWFRIMKKTNLHVLTLNYGKSSLNSTKTNESLRKGSLNSDTFTKEMFVRFGSEFILHPGQFVLGITIEWICLPSDLGGYITGKSSWGRRGLVIETAAGIHPGFRGCLTLELANVGEIPIALVPGMQVCQLFLHNVDNSEKRAKSQFIGRRKPSLGNVEVDETLAALMNKGENLSTGTT